LSAHSTDGSWNEAFIEDATGTIHKLCKLDCLAIYLNTEAKSLSQLDDPIETFTSLVSKMGN
jgi:vacuolar protein sorting-associated protein 13A/C